MEKTPSSSNPDSVLHSVVQIDEVRYQTIGKGHSFAELEGVPFKITENYQLIREPPSNIYQLANLHMGSVQALEDSSYTFDLERKVIENMEFRGC